MEVHFPPDLEAKLTERATQQGRDPDQLVQELIAHYFEEDARFIAAVERGKDSLDRGDYLSHEQVGERVQRFLQP